MTEQKKIVFLLPSLPSKWKKKKQNKNTTIAAKVKHEICRECIWKIFHGCTKTQGIITAMHEGTRVLEGREMNSRSSGSVRKTHKKKKKNRIHNHTGLVVPSLQWWWFNKNYKKKKKEK